MQMVYLGVSTVLRDIKIVDGPNAFLVLAAVVLIDAYLLWRFFKSGQPAEVAGATAQEYRYEK
jgi:hypothetical protein